jgi:hypothetical protein
MAFDAFIFRHVIKDHAATECVDVVIRFAHGHAIKDYAYGCFRETVWATFGGHEKKIWRGTDSADLRVRAPGSYFLLETGMKNNLLSRANLID